MGSSYSGCSLAKKGTQSSHRMALTKMDPTYKKWIAEKEVLYNWILDSMTPNLSYQSIEYETVKEASDAIDKHHLKKNNCSKIA